MYRTRRSAVVLAVAAAVCGFVLTGTAQAAPTAQTATAVPSGTAATQADVCRSKLAYSGYVHVYRFYGCDGEILCSLTGSDADYSNSAGCKGTDDNKASSVLNNGNSYAVRLYRLAGPSGGSICVPNHQYASDLRNWSFNDGTGPADNKISAHTWMPSC